MVLPKGETRALDGEDAKIILTIPATFPQRSGGLSG